MTVGPLNIILVGMPGVGKSIVGAILAKKMSCNFIDTDLIIVSLQSRSLQEIVDTSGHMALREIEENVLLDLCPGNNVISTGGSAVYSHDAMTHLKSNGIIVFLSIDLPTLEERVSNYDTRGLAKRPDQNFGDLYKERLSLYEKYVDLTIECGGLKPDEVCAKIARKIKNK